MKNGGRSWRVLFLFVSVFFVMAASSAQAAQKQKEKAMIKLDKKEINKYIGYARPEGFKFHLDESAQLKSLIDQAESLFKEGNKESFNSALEKVKAALQISPRDKKVLNLRVKVLFKLGERNEILRLLRDNISKDIDTPLAQVTFITEKISGPISILIETIKRELSISSHYFLWEV